MMERERGYYWVLEDQNWIILYWNGNYFYSGETPLFEDEYDKVDERKITNPNE